MLPADHPSSRLADAAYLRVARGEPSPRIPVWFQRQAGRSLPEYHRVRGEGSILDAIRRPEIAAELTLQPVRRYGVDAAILFSDIVTPLAALDLGIDVKPGVGPVTDRPIRTAADVDRVRPLEPDVDLPYVSETVRLLTAELEVPLIGFAGAPFTLASYLIEGGPSRTHGRTKAMLLGDPTLWHALCQRLADVAIASLRAQVEAGASAVQLFDSWAGALDPATYERAVLPHSTRILTTIRRLGVPTAHFGVGTGELLGLMAAAGADVVGVDWRVPLDAARRRVPTTVTLQGNLDPAVLLAPREAVEAATLDVLRRGGGRRHVVNLGHGVLPETDPDDLARVVELVHRADPEALATG